MEESYCSTQAAIIELTRIKGGDRDVSLYASMKTVTRKPRKESPGNQPEEGALCGFCKAGRYRTKDCYHDPKTIADVLNGRKSRFTRK